MARHNLIISLFLILFWAAHTSAQTEINPHDLAGQQNVITSAVPFLMIAPDSRAGAMGEVGAATEPDANAMHWNLAKYGFVDKDMGLSVSYTPWLRNLIGDISLGYLAGYKRLNKKSVLGASLRYFSLGNITFTNIHGQVLKDYNPNEFALDVGYSLLLSENFSGGISLRYVYSNLTGGAFVDQTESHPGRVLAADLSGYYEDEIKISDYESELAFGFNISNIGAKMSYTDDAIQSFIPINMRIGGRLTTEIDDYNKITVAIDMNKLLIPSPPKLVTGGASDGGDTLIGNDPTQISVASGIFKSFADAPGGLTEELHEIYYSAGLEYMYADQFAVRAGYFHEHETKGNRKFFTFGIGLKLNVFSLDFAYLVPTTGRQHPLANTMRFSLLFDFDAFREQNNPEE